MDHRGDLLAGRALGGQQSAATLDVREGGSLEVPAGTTLKVKYLKALGNDFMAGTYGSAEARDAGLVDADHTVSWLAGTGLVRARRSLNPGAVLLVR